MAPIFSFLWKIFSNKYTWYTILATAVLYFGRKLILFTWYWVSFNHPEVEKLKIDLSNAETSLKFVHAANDSLNGVIVDCTTTSLQIQDQHQKNNDSLWKANKKLTKENLILNEQIDHFMEIAPCKKEVKIKDGNPFKKNKTEWILIDCEESK